MTRVSKQDDTPTSMNEVLGWRWRHEKRAEESAWLWRYLLKMSALRLWMTFLWLHDNEHVFTPRLCCIPAVVYSVYHELSDYRLKTSDDPSEQSWRHGGRGMWCSGHVLELNITNSSKDIVFYFPWNSLSLIAVIYDEEIEILNI